MLELIQEFSQIQQVWRLDTSISRENKRHLPPSETACVCKNQTHKTESNRETSLNKRTCMNCGAVARWLQEIVSQAVRFCTRGVRSEAAAVAQEMGAFIISLFMTDGSDFILASAKRSVLNDTLISGLPTKPKEFPCIRNSLLTQTKCTLLVQNFVAHGYRNSTIHTKQGCISAINQGSLHWYNNNKENLFFSNQKYFNAFNSREMKIVFLSPVNNTLKEQTHASHNPLRAVASHRCQKYSAWISDDILDHGFCQSI